MTISMILHLSMVIEKDTVDRERGTRTRELLQARGGSLSWVSLSKSTGSGTRRVKGAAAASK